MTASTATPSQARPRSLADRLARRVLRIEDAAPRALVPLGGSLVLSAVRCVITYAVIPAAAPLVSRLDAIATPLAVLLSVAAIALAVRSLRRVWLADWSHRWGYTAFIAVVVVALLGTIAYDLRLLGT